MTVETWPINRIKPYERNARKIPQSAVDKVALSLRTFGWRQPIVVDTAGVIVVGHVRRLGALQNGYTDAPVHVADGLTPEQIKAYRLMDNRSNEETTWDLGLLGPELTDLKGFNLDLSLTGFSPAELSRLLPQDYVEPEPQLERADELQAKWQVERGQVWEIGEHRLMCGDAADPESITELMAGQKAVLMATDPPYGVSYGVDSGPDSAKRFAPIAGDSGDGPALQKFLESCFMPACEILELNAAWYLWHAQLTQGFFAAAAAAAAAQLLIHRQIIWSKSHFILGHGDYHWQHELCFYGWRAGHRARWYGERNQSTIWQIPNPRVAEHHPTEKPPELFRRPMLFNTLGGEIVYEPFAGIGTQFVAAENLKRRCYGMEIEPKYCAVTLERMADMGLTPRLAA